jgi:hypothetical protein
MKLVPILFGKWIFPLCSRYVLVFLHFAYFFVFHFVMLPLCAFRFHSSSTGSRYFSHILTIQIWALRDGTNRSSSSNLNIAEFGNTRTNDWSSSYPRLVRIRLVITFNLVEICFSFDGSIHWFQYCSGLSLLGPGICQRIKCSTAWTWTIRGGSCYFLVQSICNICCHRIVVTERLAKELS